MNRKRTFLSFILVAFSPLLHAKTFQQKKAQNHKKITKKKEDARDFIDGLDDVSVESLLKTLEGKKIIISISPAGAVG